MSVINIEDVRQVLQDFRHDLRNEFRREINSNDNVPKPCKSTHILNQHEQTLQQISRRLDDSREFWEEIREKQIEFQTSITSKLNDIQMSSKLDIERLFFKLDNVHSDLREKETDISTQGERLQKLENKVTNLLIDMEDSNKKLMLSLEVINELKEGNTLEVLKKMTNNFQSNQILKTNLFSIAAIIAAIFSFAVNFDSVTKIVKGWFNDDKKESSSSPSVEKKPEIKK